MAKDAYYFSHDSNARHDPKCSALIRDFGNEGYGFYWMIIEMLHEQGGYFNKFPKLIEGIAFQTGATVEATSKQIEALLRDYELLREDEKRIWSDRVLRNLEERGQKRKDKVEAGRLGGLKSGQVRSSNKKQEGSERSSEAALEANEAVLEANEQKESKVKERKDNIHAKNAWAIWIDCNREAGRADPVAVGKDTKASQMLWKALDGDVSKIRDVFARYLNDQDRFIVDNGHSLSLLQSRINKYLNTGTHRQEPLELSL